MTEIRKAVEGIYHYYEGQQAGLGERFNGKLDETFAQIRANPEMFNVAEDSFRQAVLKNASILPVRFLVLKSGQRGNWG